ncbi:MAG: bifunctional riboflavin kinase/FAD synthetase [Hydrococcus sp. RM1_1_31]|nr:bifunctional riboflavin kinase/FAD synthetase [Hydrococcus sp. RM1_1_31]
MWVTTSIEQILKPNAIALGNFDGIHRGHQKVLQPILQSLSKEAVGKSNSPYSTVVTFNPHPQEFFSGQSKQLLTPLCEKVKYLEKLGVEQLVLLPFDRELAALSPQQFVEEILIKHLQATRISVGQDFRFGHKRLGTAQDLKAIAANFGVEVIITALYTGQATEGEQISPRISSSLIRQALAEGDLLKANQMLGRAYTLTGIVVKGQQLGRTIGFPTANLELPPSKLLPRYGVYCVRVFIEESCTPIQGVTNIGCRPTVEGDRPTIEVHLLDWTGDLYGQAVTVSLEKFLRPEQKFASLDALKAQITADCDLARQILQR